jgi:hypothetical protein
MIQLRTDCLVFETAEGWLPCHDADIVVELRAAGPPADKELLGHAAEAVVQFFRVEKQQEVVKPGDFCEALEKVLKGFGIEARVCLPQFAQPTRPAVVEHDLSRLAADGLATFELGFFLKLRETLEGALTDPPRVLRFTGLRTCVKRLLGVRRWNVRCEDLSAQIVSYLEQRLAAPTAAATCCLVVTA